MKLFTVYISEECAIIWTENPYSKDTWQHMTLIKKE